MASVLLFAFFSVVIGTALWLFAKEDPSNKQKPVDSTETADGFLSISPECEGWQMLVISRKKGEAVQIGDATVTIHEAAANKVRLAISAPGSVRILRTELFQVNLERYSDSEGLSAHMEQMQ